MSYFCPLCQKTDWHTITGLENHIWQSHKESKCCMDHYIAGHRSRAASKDVPSCGGGHISMATCAARNVYRLAGMEWPRAGFRFIAAQEMAL